MRVLKRNGNYEDVDLNKITRRISKLKSEISMEDQSVIDPIVISQKVCASLYDGITTSELDTLASDIAIGMGTLVPEYSTLAAFIVVSDLQKEVSKQVSSFSECIKSLYNNGFIDEKIANIVNSNEFVLNSAINHAKDYGFDYFAMKTLIKGYLQQTNGKIVETPQYMFMRVSLGIHHNDIESAIETYNLMSQKYFTHATPTLFNSASKRPQMASCFLLAMQDDSIKGIYDTLGDCAQISKWAGGIGLHIHNIRSRGASINNVANVGTGIVPMLKIFNDTARYVNQCFTGDTMIFTKRGAQRIDNITTNDKVITKDGTFKKVVQIFSHNVSKEILEIKTQSSFEPIKVTKEHHLYVIKRPYKGLNYNVILKRLHDKTLVPEFIKASELKESYLVGFPKQDFNELLDMYSSEYYRIIGILIGDGSITNKEVKFYLNNSSKLHVVEFVKKYLDANNIHYWTHVNGQCISIGCSLSSFNNISYDLLYNNEGEKIIHPEFLTLTKTNSLCLLKGMIETDGSYLKEIVYSTTSYQLAYDIKQLLLKFGIPSSGYSINNIGKRHEIRPGEYITTRKISYCIRIPRLEDFRTCVYNVNYQPTKYLKSFEFDGLIWSGIKHIENITYEGPVYDLEVSDNHNYTVASFGLVHNSGKRPGSIAIYLQVDHPDIFSFLDLRKNTGDEEERARDLFYAIWVPDLFMEKVKKKEQWCLFDPHKCPGLADVYGEDYETLYAKYENEEKYNQKIDAQDLWMAICTAQIETGTPYILYKDACNKKSNQQNVGTIKSSNLCVSGDTLILTNQGYQNIKSLANKDISVWNGTQFSSTVVKCTGKNQQLYEVKTTYGRSIKCTEYHKFYLKNGTTPVSLNQLKVGDKLCRAEFPTIDSGKSMNTPYTHGLFCADGTISKMSSEFKHQCNYKAWNKTNFCKRHQNRKAVYTNDENQCNAESFTDQKILYLYDEKKELLQHLSYISCSFAKNRINLQLDDNIENKYFVPINYNIHTKLQWLAGLCDGDGCIVKYDKIKNIQISSIHKHFLQEVVYLLHTLGVQVKMSTSQKHRRTQMPKNDGSGELKMYDCHELYRISIDAKSLIHLQSLGFKTHRLNIDNCKEPHHVTNVFESIDSITKCNELEDTYCFNEPIEHKGIFNGILTGNCTEILEYTDKDEIAVCNLASICLPQFVDTNSFDHEKLHTVAQTITRNLNKVIDNSYYPVPQAERSNKRHRPIGIGVQGLADVYQLLGIEFDSPEAAQINEDIFETIYHGAMTASIELAKCDGPYETFANSPLSNGQFQFDLWNTKPKSNRYDWENLRETVKTYGARNSLLLAPMPTATTSQIMGNNEAIEPYTSNLYLRRTIAGEFVVINKHLVKELRKLNLWNDSMKNKIIYHEGSVQPIAEIPEHIKKVYKTAWEISQKVLIDQAADRGKYVCQSQSLNLFVPRPNLKILSSMHFYGWNKGLKTGIYYLRTKPAANAIQFTIDKNSVCESCSS